MKRFLFPLGVVVVCSFTMSAATVPISLAPADWELNGTPTGSYSFTQTAEGYLRVTSSYRPSAVSVRSKTVFNLQGPATLRYKWRMNTAGQYGATNDAPTPFGRLGSTYMTVHHSWAGSIVITNNTWIYTEVVVHENRTLDFRYSYGGYGGAPIHSTLVGTYTLNDAQWDALATSVLTKWIGDCYTTAPYFELSLIHI